MFLLCLKDSTESYTSIKINPSIYGTEYKICLMDLILERNSKFFLKFRFDSFSSDLLIFTLNIFRSNRNSLSDSN